MTVAGISFNGTEHAMAARLRRHAVGSPLADRLGLPRAPITREALAGAVFAGDADESALSIDHFAGLPSLSERARYAATKLFPPRDYLQARWPLARRGAAGLAAVRVARVLACVAGLPRAIRDWRRYRARHG